MLFRSKPNTDFFSSPPDLSHRFYLINQVAHNECSIFIESLSTLKNLLTEKSLQKEDPVLRFLVDTSGIAWFARETRPNISAPKHFQMTGKSQENACCSTAGNIKFTNSKCTVLKKINHRSGGFRPSFNSLRVFLAILILNEKILPFKLSRILIIKELDPSGATRYKHRWRLSQIKNWVNTFCDNTELVRKLTQPNVSNKKVYYSATKANNEQELID